MMKQTIVDINMNIPRVISFFLILIGIAHANTQDFELVVGQSEAIDLKYGYEWPYFGVAITTGVVLYTASKIVNDEVIPTVWNPSLSLFKSIPLTDIIAIIPNLSTIYFYGYSGMLAVSSSNVVQTREDKVYLKGSVGMRYRLGHWFIQIDPGLAYRSDYTYIVKGKGLSIRKHDGDTKFDGLNISGCIGFQLGAK